MKIILFLLSLTITLLSQIIPPENRITWTPGIPHGIHLDIATKIYNVLDYGADSSGSSNSLPAINAAVSAASNGGGVIYFPAGTYRIDGSLSINDDNITLRGDGPQRSKLNFYNPTKTSCIEVVTYGRGDWQGISNYHKGDTVLIVEDGSQFTVGEFAEIQQENDTAFMYTDPKWNKDYAQNVVGQLLEVTAINGNKITVRHSLHIDYQSRFNPTIRPQRLIKSVNIEDLYLELKTDSDVYTIYYKNAAYGRVKNIESYHTRKAHVQSESSIGCEVIDSKFSRSYDYGGSGHGYGVSLGYHTTDWLVQNNIFDSLRHAMIFSKGANGNVIAYNYSQNVLQGSGETNLNDGWYPPDISSHGHYAYMNLIEGNSANEVGISDYWGPSGPGNTYFRNRIVPSDTTEGISMYDVTTKQNIIGNSASEIRDADGHAFDNLEEGNVIDGVLLWSDTITDKILPYSYYLTAKPVFFDTIPWPLYGPAEGYEGKLPAELKAHGESTPIVSNLSKKEKTIAFNSENGKITVFSFVMITDITIFNIRGGVISSSIVNRNSYSFDIKLLSSGIYFAKIRTQNGGVRITPFSIK